MTLRIYKVLLLFSSLLLMTGCINKVYERKRDALSSERYFGKIEAIYDGEHFSGDIAIIVDGDDVIFEIYSFGTLVLRGTKKDNKISFYYLGREYEEEELPLKLIPIRFDDFSKIIEALRLGKEMEIRKEEIVVRTESDGKTKVIKIIEPYKYDVTIRLEDLR